MPNKLRVNFRILLICALCTLLSSCAQGYDRYMEEGRKFYETNEYQKAKEKFHLANFEARKEKKLHDKQIKAIVSEIECCNALKLADDAVSLSDEDADVYLKDGFIEKSAAMRKQAADLSVVAGNSTAASSYYDKALSDLKSAGKPRSNIEAAILVAKAELASNRQEYKAACNL